MYSSVRTRSIVIPSPLFPSCSFQRQSSFALACPIILWSSSIRDKDENENEDEEGRMRMKDRPDIDSPPAEDYLVREGDLENDQEEEEDSSLLLDGIETSRVRSSTMNRKDPSSMMGVEDPLTPPSWAASAERMQALRHAYRRHDTDTGSPEYQVAGLTERIQYLTQHLRDHPTDFSTRRGLVALVNKRRRLLNYLFRRDVQRYQTIIAGLGIRHKAPGRVPDKVEKYSRFPPQKAVKKHLVK